MLCWCVVLCAAAEYADQLRAAEKAQGIEPDAEIDALLKASAVEGKRSNIVTDLMLRVLGLEVRGRARRAQQQASVVGVHAA